MLHLKMRLKPLENALVDKLGKNDIVWENQMDLQVTNENVVNL